MAPQKLFRWTTIQWDISYRLSDSLFRLNNTGMASQKCAMTSIMPMFSVKTEFVHFAVDYLKEVNTPCYMLHVDGQPNWQSGTWTWSAWRQWRASSEATHQNAAKRLY